MIEYETFLRLEAEGLFYPERKEHLLSAQLHMLLLLLASKGGARQELEQLVSDPEIMRLIKPTPLSEQEKHERACQADRAFFGSLLEMAGKRKIKRISREQFRSQYGV